MKREIKIGAILGYINMILNIFIAFLYTPFTIKMMGQSEYGLYSLVASVIAYLSVLDMGFGNAMVRFVSKNQAKKNNDEAKINGMFLFIYIIIGIIALLVGFVLLSKVEVLFSSSLNSRELIKAKKLIFILVVSVAISFPLSVFDSYIIANEKYTFIKFFTILKTILKPLLMIPLLFMGYKSLAMTCIVAVVNVLYHIGMFVYSVSKLKMRFSFSIKTIDKKLFSDIIIYSFFIFLNIIVDNVFNNTDQVILGIVSGTVAVSIYAVASQIVQMNTQCSTVISSLFLPKITKLLEEENANKKVSDLFLKVSRIQIFIMTLILSGFTIFGEKFICRWAGIEYIDAYYIVLLLIGFAIIPLTQNLAISVIQARNQHQFRSVVYIIIAVINILISIPLAKSFGGIGAAIGSAFANLLGQIIIMNIFYYKKVKLDIPSYWKFFIKFSIQVSLIVCIFILFRTMYIDSIIKYIITILLYSILYFVLVYINLNIEEKKYLHDIINKVLSKIQQR